MYQSRLIDLSNYKPEDLILTGIKGGSLSISTQGSPSVTIKGKNADLEPSFDLAIIDLGTLTKAESISGEGLFMVPCSGLDRVILEVSGSGKIKIKELA